MGNTDLSELDEVSLVRMVEAPDDALKWLQPFINIAVVLFNSIAIAIQNLCGHSDHGGFLSGLIFSMTSLVMLGIAENNRRSKALLQLYKNLKAQSKSN